MGNSFGNLGRMRKRSVKVMKISGETFKLKTPVRAGSVLDKHPGHVLLDSESVKHFGVRAKPLEPQQELNPKRLYFLVEMPKIPPEDKTARRVRSGIQMTAKDRLESLMLARRSASDLYIMKPPAPVPAPNTSFHSETAAGVRVKMRLPRAEVERLMAESKDGAEVAEKIVGLCMANGAGAGASDPNLPRKQVEDKPQVRIKPREKRVGFLPITEGEIHLAVAS